MLIFAAKKFGHDFRLEARVAARHTSGNYGVSDWGEVLRRLRERCENFCTTAFECENSNRSTKYEVHERNVYGLTSQIFELDVG